MGLRLFTVLLLSVAVLMGSCARRSALEVGGAVPHDAPSAEPEVIERGVAEATALAELRSAEKLAGAGDLAGATRAYARAGRALPALRGWPDVLAAGSAASAGDTARVRVILAGSPDSALIGEWGWRVRTAALRQSGDLRGAVAVARESARDGAGAQARAEGWRVAGSLLLQGGDSARALDAFRFAMQESMDVRPALEAARAVVEWKGLSPDDQLLVGRTLLRHGGVERGGRMTEGYLAAAVGSTASRAEVRLELGEALMRAQKHAEAEPHLILAAASLPRAELLAGRIQYRLGRLEVAAGSFRSVAKRDPRSPEASEALFFLADMAHDRGDVDAARDLYRRAVATGAETDAALRAVLRLAGMAVSAGNAREARRDISAYLEGRVQADLRAPALYWAGRAAALAGDDESARSAYREAIALDPVSYYGVRALERLGMEARNLALPLPPEVNAAGAAAVEEGLARVRVLRELGLRDEADFERGRLREGLAGSEGLYLLAEALQREGRTIEAVGLARELARQRGAWDRRLLAVVYPFPFRGAVEREAARNGLNPFLVAGLIRQESLFNPTAVSPAGAIGLMQVMPETGRSLAGRVGVEGFSPAALKDPDTNLRLGSLFLADQVGRYRTLSEVFAAYNAGPTRVTGWRSSFPESADEDAFVERIPYSETRDYVKKLRLNKHIYELLYADGTIFAAR